MHRIELSGGPYDGHRAEVEDLLGRLTIDEPREPQPDELTPTMRLLAGERILASEWENPGVVQIVYSRTEPARHRNGARVYEFVPHQPLEQRS